MAKTSVHLNYASSIWPVVEKWAGENYYALETQSESARRYLRSTKEASAKIRIAISQVNEDVQIQAWFSDFVRKELEIDSPSLYAKHPRKKALSEIQKLLAALGTAPPRKTKTTKKGNLAFNFGRSIRKISGKK